MARTNEAAKSTYVRPVTHEGAPAAEHLTAEATLRRSVMACLLWEDQFYEDGKTIASRIGESAASVSDGVLARIAIEAREEQHLRHVPLLLLSILCHPERRTTTGMRPADAGFSRADIARTITRVIKRADELAELPAVYAKYASLSRADLAKKMPAQMKKGIAAAFQKFDAYQLAKYNRDSAIKLRDVMFVSHAKPKDDEQKAVFKTLANGTLFSADTWEVALSGGKDKKETFERLLGEGRLGYMALLRNLRNMLQAGVDEDLLREAIIARKGAHNVLPFRFVTAAKYAPQLEPALDKALVATVKALPRLPGKTVVLVDVSTSMHVPVSAKSQMRRCDAAATLASVVNGDCRVFSFSYEVVEVPPRIGMAGVAAILGSQVHSGTRLGAAVQYVNEKVKHDRLIVLTDEQSEDRVPKPVASKAYMVNLASYQNGVGYKPDWLHIDGWSEHIFRYIYAAEGLGDIGEGEAESDAT